MAQEHSTMAAVPQEQLEALRQQAMEGDDSDLPVEDRRDREVIIEGMELEVFQLVTLTDGTEANILGPGRGRENAAIGYQEEFWLTIGTAHKSQIVVDGV